MCAAPSSAYVLHQVYLHSFPCLVTALGQSGWLIASLSWLDSVQNQNHIPYLCEVLTIVFNKGTLNNLSVLIKVS